MKTGLLLGAALVLLPFGALAGEPNNATGAPRAPAESQRSGHSQPSDENDLTTRKLLPTDAKLVGSVESTEVRAFPEQMGTGEQAKRLEKEQLVGVGGVDRVWTTKQPYKRVVGQLDQKLKNEGIEPIAKTTTQSATAWNVRMPDGHIANVVVRNTQPTTIESVQAAAVLGTMTESGRGSQATAPSSKSKASTNTNDDHASQNGSGENRADQNERNDER